MSSEPELSKMSRKKSGSDHNFGLGIVKDLYLDKFCSKKLFQIVFITAATPNDEDFLKTVSKNGKKYENISFVNFITHEDVTDFLKLLVNDRENVNLPLYIKDALENHPEEILTIFEKNQNIPLNLLAKLTKLKIIEAMYKNYSSEVVKMQKRKELRQSLDFLLVNCEEKVDKGKKKKGKEKKGKKDKSSKSSKSSKKGKKDKKKGKSTTMISKKSSQKINIVEDYTDIILEEDEIVKDYNVDNQVMFYVLSGFQQVGIFEKLAKLQIHVSSIIEVADEEPQPGEYLDKFALQLHNLFEQQVPYFEDTVLMKFSPSDKQEAKKILEEFCYAVKSVNYIKRQHLKYIKNLNLQHLGAHPKKLIPKCLEKYSRIMNSYPPECINIPLILEAIIEEICWIEEGAIYSLSDLSDSSKSESIHCKPKKPKAGPIKKTPETYQIHEEDQLGTILHSYKGIGRIVYDSTLKYLQFLEPLQKVEPSPGSVKTTRDVGVPEEDSKENRDIQDYIHLALFQTMKGREFSPKLPLEYDLTKNIITYNEGEQWLKSLPCILGDDDGKCTTNDDIVSNYHFKEKLSKSVFLQMIFKANSEFCTCDKKFCPETDATLLKFHDNLNEGVNTKIWNQCLPTPVCLRDFCIYNTVEKKEWLEKNKIVEHSQIFQELEEKCQGVRDLIQTGLYEEYKHLLEDTSESSEGKEGIFGSALEELVTYPEGKVLTTFCNQDESEQILAYDLGYKRLQLTGCTTTFKSSDGVKITVDNSRFLHETPKCSVKIAADDNLFIFNSRNLENFHCVLPDETIINFGKDFAENREEIKRNIVEEKEEISDSSSDTSFVNIEEQRIVGVPQDEFLEQFQARISFNSLRKFLQELKTAVEFQRPIYKILLRKPAIHVKKLFSTTFPFAGVIKRILFKPPRKQKFRGYTIISTAKNTQNNVYNLKITLPNGLLITTLPKVGEIIELKQTYKFAKLNEKYRIFYKNGVVLVKNSDGSTTIMRGNGDIIELNDNSNLCDPTCPQNMTKIFQKNEGEIVPFLLSRCPAPVVKNDADFKVAIYEFGEIPYVKKSIVDFNGKKSTEIYGKVKEEQVSYLIYEDDFNAEEKFYERDDGFRCLIDKKGKREIQFPDGTKICSWYEIEKELITVDPKTEGWVSISINYKFEHPKYISFIYDQIGKSTEIFLNDTIIKNCNNSYTMSVGENIAVEISQDQVFFLKTCEDCESDCLVKINTNPISVDETFVQLCDSYERKFSSDFLGNCFLNSDFIKEKLNANECDHFRKNEDQKLFVVKKDSVSFLWKDSAVEEKLKKADEGMKINNYINRASKKQTIEIFTNVYQNFEERFTMSHFYERKISLSKKISRENVLYYVTFRILEEFFDDRRLEDVAGELEDFLDTNKVYPELLEGLKDMLRVIGGSEAKQRQPIYHLELQDNASVENSAQTDVSSDLNEMQFPEKPVHDLENVQRIIGAWRENCNECWRRIRNKEYVPYFKSQYYRDLINKRI